MENLNIALIIIFIFTLILDYLYQNSKKTAIETVNDMGIGYNLGKTFNIFDTINITQNYQIKMWGTILPTKKMINNIKKNGFKTIRFQVIPTNSMEDSGKINNEWISRIKEIIDWIINSNMYCILSVYYEGNYWRRKNISSEYINFWKQITNELKNFNEHLILESMNEYNYEFLYDYYEEFEEDIYYDSESYYNNLFNSTQDFIYTIRNSGGFNKERLLIIPEFLTEIEINSYNFIFESKIPIDPSNKLAVSLNYYFPSQINQNIYLYPMNWYNKYGLYYSAEINNNWGSDKDYKDIMKYFDYFKNNYINKGIPVIISQAGIITEKENNVNSFKEFLYVIFSISAGMNGVMSCLWDISEKIVGDICYYNKEKNIWRDEQIKENFIKISKGKYINPSEYYYNTKIETEISSFSYYLEIDIGTRKISKIIINVKLLCKLHIDCEFVIINNDINWIEIIIEDNGKKQYDGTTIFTIDVSDKDLSGIIRMYINWGDEYISFNNLTVEYEENYLYFDYKSYKSNILENINKIN